MPAKISLCMIVGNVEEYIERCLNSFLPHFDELCVVRAIGNQAPDKTLDVVTATAARLGVPLRLGEYKNKPEHADWPHIDSFAAARQMSYDLATSEYCFWCDSDDILKTGGDRIRKHAEAAEFACYIFPYDVFGKNVVVPRERMMLKEAGAWQHPVHECFTFKVKDAPAAMDDGIVVQHLPHLTKTGSNDRNLRILQSIPESEMTVGLKYHLFGELIGAGRIREAIPIATQLLTEEANLGKDERYDLLLSLVIQTPDLKQRVDLLHEAHKADPERREALGVLACTMMDMGRPASAMAYARQMAATQTPDVQCWNSRQPFYGYVGDDIYQQALRVNDRLAEAEAVRRHSLHKHGGPRIALLHATRGRPEKASKCRKAWHDLAAEPGRIEHIFAIDDDDPQSAILRRFHHVVVPAGGGCVRAWNISAQFTTAPIVVQLSDDWIPVPQWDNLLVDRIGDVNQPKVLAISDGVRADALLCMAICTRAYLAQDFFFFHPWFTGVYSDNWFTDEAYRRRAVIEARDIVFRHDHPIAGAEWDATYAAQNAPHRYAEGLAVYEQLKKRADWSTVPGFFNYWRFYEIVAGKLKDGDTVAEVGVWLGRSIIFLAQHLKRIGKPNVKLIAVDTFKGEISQPEHQAVVAQHGGSIRAAFEANVARCGVADMIQIIEGDSAESAAQIPDSSLAFCFIDAAHDYDSVKRDLVAWKPKLKEGGTLSGHDADHGPVAKAVRELIPNPTIIGCIWTA